MLQHANAMDLSTKRTQKIFAVLVCIQGFVYGSFVFRIGGKDFVIFFFLANLFLQLI
jgi:hypothetical protein